MIFLRMRLLFRVYRKLDLMAMVQVLHNNLDFESVLTRVAVLRWIHHLYQKMPSRVFPHMEELFPNLLKLLSDVSDDVSYSKVVPNQ